MKFIADLHTHSRFSRATSKSLDPEHLSLWARKKGIAVVGTGDFTHPGWFSELGAKLRDAPFEGLYQLNPESERALDSKAPPACSGPTRFLLTGEISCIYKKDGRTRKLHHLILMPDMDTVARFNRRLDRIGNISSDGRPILGLDSKALLEITLETSEKAFFIPAHIWTPWFSLFGSKSGFDAIEECFEDLTGHIYALETGLSSDPLMNRCISALDPYLLVSNSDAHSPGKLGREGNLFDTHLDYPHMIQAMKTGAGFAGTIEFFPEEGKYHLDGHRNCGVRLHPEETLRVEGICPVCGRPLTVGVLNRIYELSDRSAPLLSKAFHSLIPLPEILSEILGCGPESKKATLFYEKLLTDLGPELEILMDVPMDRLEASGGPVLAEAIRRMRCNQVIRDEGYDGHFGTIHLFQESEKARAAGQSALFAIPARNPSASPGPAPIPARKRLHSVKKPAAQPTPSLATAIPVTPLNPEQQAAVRHDKGHLLIMAGPGTGKTLTLTHRIAHLIRERRARPEQVLCLTFTRKAAGEMRDRIFGLLSNSEGGRVRVATFHGFCLDLLRGHTAAAGLPTDFALCSEIDREAIARDVLDRQGPGKPSLARFLKALSSWRAEQVLGPLAGADESDSLPLCREYQRILREAGMLDLDELETEALRLLRQHPTTSRVNGEVFVWICVDEYQDTNPVQAAILKELVNEGNGEICAIGDPDQAIYGFRGADVKNFYRFAQDFPGAREVVLSRNYRSSPSILKGSAAVIKRERPLIPRSSAGGPIALAHCRTESEEAEMIVEQVERLMGGTSHFSMDSGRVASHEGEGGLAFGDISVLYRLNAQGDALAAALDRAGIPYVRSGEAPLISAYPVNMIWRYLQTLRYPDTPYYARAWEHLKLEGVPGFDKEGPRPPAGDDRVPDILDNALALLGVTSDSDKTDRALSRLKDLAVHCEEDLEAFLDLLSIERGIDHALLAGDRLALMSLHASKGLEWEVVFITGCEDRVLPCLLFGDRDLEEERRLFYVGMTRARSRLILSHAKRRFLNGRPLEMNPSPFLNLIPEDVSRPLDREGWKPKKPPARQLTLF